MLWEFALSWLARESDLVAVATRTLPEACDAYESRLLPDDLRG